MLGGGGCGRCFEDHCFEGHSVGGCGDGDAVRGKVYMSSVLVQTILHDYFKIFLIKFKMISDFEIINLNQISYLLGFILSSDFKNE